MDCLKLVSIIVPVYNGEKHIGKCIETLLGQTYKEIEVLVVNDGSQDKTQRVIAEWVQKDNRIVLINKENEGVSVARNVGLKAAKGEYILFVDSDDSLESKAVELLMNVLDVNSCEVLFFGFYVNGDESRKNDTKTLKKLEKLNTEEVKLEVLKSIISTTENIYGYIWRAMYSRQMLNTHNVVFPKEIKISEDYMFLLNAVNVAQSVRIITEELYIYNLGESSMSNKYIPTLLHDMNYVNEWMYGNIVIKNEDMLLGYYCSVSNTYLRYVQNAMRNKGKSFNDKHIEIRKNKKEYGFQKIIKQVWSLPRKFDIKSKIGMIMFRFNLELFYEILFILKIMLKERK